MARYTGPACKLCRREGMKLVLKGDKCATPKCPIERRNFPPGSHSRARQRKPTEFGLQLREKQKARRIYGILEKQFRRHFEQAESLPGVTGDNLLRLLELRLDNVVFRLGLADSRNQARQIVRHGHVEVNGRKTNIPSFIARPGDRIAVRGNSRGLEYFKALAASLGRGGVPDWLDLDARAMVGRVVAPPTREQIDTRLSEQLIVEHYSR